MEDGLGTIDFGGWLREGGDTYSSKNILNHEQSTINSYAINFIAP